MAEKTKEDRDCCAHCGRRNAPMACPKCSTAFCNARCQGENWQYHKAYACCGSSKQKKGVEYLVPPTMSAKDDEIVAIPFARLGIKKCNCGRSDCTHNQPFSVNRPMGGRMSFMGILSMPDGTNHKLDDPRDFGIRKGVDLAALSGIPGHSMTQVELMSEFSHCDDYDGDFHETHGMRDIGPRLVDFSGRKKGNDICNTMYPFHAKLKPPYKNSKPPKFRSDDVVTVVVSKELKLSDSHTIAPKNIVQVYIVSFTASGIVTGVIETNVEQYWVYFPHHRVRQLVKRGMHWK